LRDSILLDHGNWLVAAREAVRTLPDDVAECVGVTELAHRIRLAVVVEPLDNGESYRSHIDVEWFDTVRECHGVHRERREQRRKADGLPRDHSPYAGFPPQFTEPGGLYYERRDSPIITVQCNGKVQWIFPGNAMTRSLTRMIQKAVLEAIFADCSGMIGKDSRGRFVRDDGFPVLEWQFKRE